VHVPPAASEALVLAYSYDWRSEREVDENQAGECRWASDDTSQSLQAKLSGNHRGYFAEPGGVY
jgi:hypothetical protein